MLYGLIGVLIFSASLPLTRYLIKPLSYWDIGIGRGLLASLAALLILWVMKNPIPNKQQILWLMLASVGVVFGFPIFTAVGMQYAPANHGAVILGGMPLMTAIMGALVNREKPSIAFWAVSILGLALVMSYALIEGGFDTGLFLGDIALLIAVILAGTGYAIGGKLAVQMGGISVICWIMVLSLPLQIVLGVVYVEPSALMALNIVEWSAMLFLSLGCSLIGFFFWYGGMGQAGVVRVSQLQYAQPFFTVLIATMFLQEKVNLTTIGFMISIVIVIALSRKMRVSFG